MLIISRILSTLIARRRAIYKNNIKNNYFAYIKTAWSNKHMLKNPFTRPKILHYKSRHTNWTSAYKMTVEHANH